jgi:hypothetical protein
MSPGYRATIAFMTATDRHEQEGIEIKAWGNPEIPSHYFAHLPLARGSFKMAPGQRSLQTFSGLLLLIKGGTLCKRCVAIMIMWNELLQLPQSIPQNFDAFSII